MKFLVFLVVILLLFGCTQKQELKQDYSDLDIDLNINIKKPNIEINVPNVTVPDINYSVPEIPQVDIPKVN